MAIINVKEVEKEIAWHEGRIKALTQLLELVPLLDEDAAPRRGRPAKSTAKPGRKPKAKTPVKRKRGAITEQIKTLLENANGPVASGAIRSALEKSGVIAKGSVTIYSQLQQMAKRGVIGKTADGYVAAGDAPKSKKKTAKAKAGRKKKAPSAPTAE